MQKNKVKHERTTQRTVKPEFNLVDSKWISVLTLSGEQKDVSLLEVFKESRGIRKLSGETELQNTAVLRFLLAILHTVITRKDNDKNPIVLDNISDSLVRWKTIWDARELPAQLIEDYLMEWKDSFWLIHPDCPFYQRPEVINESKFGAEKLFGDLLASNNKDTIRMFVSRSGLESRRCLLPEAARWLLYTHGYEEAAFGRATAINPVLKNKGKKASPGVGRLGKLSQIYAEGSNLFETLMLNCVLLQNGEHSWESSDIPYWEQKIPERQLIEKIQVDAPDDFAGILTFQTRWLLLEPSADNRYVTGFHRLPGRCIDEKLVDAEQFTLWKKIKSNVPEFEPKRFDSSRQIWRDFGNIFPGTESGLNHSIKLPGVVLWIQRLVEEDILRSSDHISFKTYGIQYNDKNSVVKDNFGDAITFPVGLLLSDKQVWVDQILCEICIIDKIADKIGWLSKELAIVSGKIREKDPGKAERSSEIFEVTEGKQKYYFSIERSFRKWIKDLEISGSDPNSASKTWRNQLKKQAMQVCDEIAGDYPISTYFGRELETSKKEKNGYIDGLPSLLARCKWSISTILGENS